MDLSEQTLRDIIAGIPHGETAPYSGGSTDDIEEHLHRFAKALGDSRLLKVEADFNHYGSGYASYVDLFCWKKDESFQHREDDSIVTQGIVLYLSRLAPCAVYGHDERWKSANGGARSLLRPQCVESLPSGDWGDEIYAIKRKLSSAGIELLTRTQVEQPLGFEAEIPTILNEGRYTVFDALFYWED